MTLPRSPYARLVAAMAAMAAAAGARARGVRRARRPPRAGSPGTLPVVASFYPLAFATAQIGGDHVAVTNLTRPGAEPHELELSPRDVATVSTARVVVYEKGLQPAVDEAVAQEAPDRGLDVARTAKLDLPSPRSRAARRTPTAPAPPTRTSGWTRSATPRSPRPSRTGSPPSTPRTAPTTRRAPQRSGPGSPGWTATSARDWPTAPTRRSSPATTPSATWPSATG